MTEPKCQWEEKKRAWCLLGKGGLEGLKSIMVRLVGVLTNVWRWWWWWYICWCRIMDCGKVWHPPEKKTNNFQQPVRSHLVQPMSCMVLLRCTELTVCYGKWTVTVPTQGWNHRTRILIILILWLEHILKAVLFCFLGYAAALFSC
jgi:hypothetical protein